MDVGKFCEVAFLICFFASWPVSIRKSLKSRTAKGKSCMFEIFLLLGYIAGIIGKLWSLHIYGEFQYVTILYFVNSAMVAIDIGLCVRNKHLDARRDAGEIVD